MENFEKCAKTQKQYVVSCTVCDGTQNFKRYRYRYFYPVPNIFDTDTGTFFGTGSEQSVTFVKILIQMNVRIYSYQQNYTNEYPNIFILIFLTRTNVRISIRIENCTNI